MAKKWPLAIEIFKFVLFFGTLGYFSKMSHKIENCALTMTSLFYLNKIDEFVSNLFTQERKEVFETLVDRALSSLGGRDDFLFAGGVSRYDKRKVKKF